MSLDPRLQGLLVCPACRGPLTEAADALVCEAEGLRYPVVDGVPHLVPELARKVAGERRGRSTGPPEEHAESADAPPAADPHNP